MKPELCCLQDIGCGVGGPTRTVARATGAHVVGLNISDYQLRRAKQHTEKAGLKSQVSYMKVSFIKFASKKMLVDVSAGFK